MVRMFVVRVKIVMRGLRLSTNLSLLEDQLPPLDRVPDVAIELFLA